MIACSDSLYMVSSCIFVFRLSNLFPHSFNAYDSTRHLSGGDVFWDDHSFKILVK